MLGERLLHAATFVQNVSGCKRFSSTPKSIKELYQRSNEWHQFFPLAAGKQQSPVDLTLQDSNICEHKTFPKLSIDYTPSDIQHVINNGHSVTFWSKGPSSVVFGGPLKNKHKLVQFHFHWGSKDHYGSEHTLNGSQFSAELHLVHLNEKYSEVEEAMKQKDGLCVLGVLLQVQSEKSEAYTAVVDALSHVKNKGDEWNFANGLNAEALLPVDRKYVFYNGSLTTPPLNECVQWITFTQPVGISREQIDAFRRISCNEAGEEAEHMVDNFRPVQPLHGRKLHLCD